MAPLGLGTAGFATRRGSRAVLALLHAALDEGITHFDTARMYGLGQAESALGKFLAGRRHQLTVATKVGILPPPALLSRVLPARSLRGPFGSRQDFHVRAVRASFKQSLKELRTDYVDALFLHECTPMQVTDDLIDFLLSCVSEGTARAIGTATDREATEAIIRRRNPFPSVVQIPWEPFANVQNAPTSRRDGGPETITYSSVGFVLNRVWRPLHDRPLEIQRWSEELDTDCTQSDEIAGLALALAQRDNPGGRTLFSSRSAERISANCQRARMYSRDVPRIERFAAMVRAELAGAR